jgi:hypothetical protein
VRGVLNPSECGLGAGFESPGEIVGRLPEEHRFGNAVSLAKFIDVGQVFGFEWRANGWTPMFQFEADDLPSLWSGWTLARLRRVHEVAAHV